MHYMIVGQGIAGSLLAWQLMQAGCRVMVFGGTGLAGASMAASGVINPITGKRFVKSWMLDELIPAATQTYTELEGVLQTQVFRQMKLMHLFNSNEEINDWSAKAATKGYELYLPAAKLLHLPAGQVINPFGCFEVHECLKVEGETLLAGIRNWLRANDALAEERFEMQQLSFSNGGVCYGTHTAERIIFAGGHEDAAQSFFAQAKFAPVKGEGLIIKINDFFSDAIVHGDVMITPTSLPGCYYVGSTYEWNFSDAQPTAARREELVGRIRKTIACDFEVVQHVAGIRPATNNRRPVMGLLPENNKVGIFNGMGTKGYSLAPFFSRHFASHLLSGTPLLKEVDFLRFC